jgi:DNA-binding response OmpR family regulator
MQSKATVLLAEDDTSLAFVIKDNLEEENYEVAWCADGEAAWQRYIKGGIDICLLDVMMPVKDGFTLAKKIRQKSDVVPILFITAKSLEQDKLDGFKTGADDYITKPFSMKELLLRMDVFLRRTKKMHSEQVKEYKLSSLVFSFTDLKLFSKGEEISLTQREADLLKFFCEHPNKVVKREEVLLSVWGKDDYFLGRSMDVFITRLRKYFKMDASVILETIHGIGFRLNIPE